MESLCVYNGGIAREYWIFFIKKQNVICFFRKKKSWQIVWKKIEQIQQIQRKRQGESEFAIWQLRGQLAAMDQNMEEAAYCMEQATERCKMYCGEKNQMYSAMSEELARMYNAAGRRKSRWHVILRFAISA